MRWLLGMLLIVSLIACGGGNGDDDETTPTTARASASPTTRSSPAATTPASPTSDGSPAAVASRQPGGSGIEPASTSTVGSSEPTPTRRPVTVVTTPRPIAKTPTPRVRVQEATETPTEAADDGVTVVVDETFDDPAAVRFFIGESDYGIVAAVDSGIYTLAVPEATWQNMDAIDTGDLGNAMILIEAGMQGEGAVGVVGRSMANSDETWTFYVCWLATDGRAGCHVSINSEWTQLFTVPEGSIEFLEVNELFLSVDGDVLYFDVNNIEIGTITDGASATGSWGVFAESFLGTSVARYDRVTIAVFDE